MSGLIGLAVGLVVLHHALHAVSVNHRDHKYMHAHHIHHHHKDNRLSHTAHEKTHHGEYERKDARGGSFGTRRDGRRYRKR